MVVRKFRITNDHLFLRILFLRKLGRGTSRSDGQQLYHIQLTIAYAFKEANTSTILMSV
jgi:hypothetical protein